MLIEKIINIIKKRTISPFVGNTHLSEKNLRDDILYLKTNISNTLIQLSSGTILLTFTLLKFVKDDTGNLFYLKISWILFVLSIFSGLLFHYYLISHLVIFPIAVKKQQVNAFDKYVTELFNVWFWHILFEGFQFLFFSFGVLFLVTFAIIEL